MTTLKGVVIYDRRVDSRIESGTVDTLLACYRYFKELRNCIAHSGWRANQNLLSAQSRILAEKTALTVVLNEVPELIPVAQVGEKIQVSLRGVVGLSEVMLRIVAKNDCELLNYSVGCDAVANKLLSMSGFRWERPAYQETAKQISRAANKLGLPTIQSNSALIAEMKRRLAVPDYL